MIGPLFVAAYGYRTVARFANIAAPWMVLIFLGFALVGLRQFMNATVLLPFLFLLGVMNLDNVKMFLMIVTLLWFVAAALWMWKNNSE